MRPLPRSLNPVPDETLPSFLLRLAHRLTIAPLRLAEHIGLLPRTGNVISPRHLLRMDPELTAHIAGTCRLSVQEVHNLTLAAQAPGFPPLHPDYLSPGRPFEAVVNEGWVFTRFSRFCPECLGDIDDTATASCWSGTWRLPMTFACLRHRRFLDWQCPACGNPAFSAGIGTAGRWRPASLIPSPLANLHPAQCRSRITGHGEASRSSRPCGHRLDRANSPAVRPAPDVIALQRRLLDLACAPAPGPVLSAGRPASAAEHFNNLRAITLLICGTWPTAAELFPDIPQLNVIASHVEERLTAQSKRQQGGHRASTLRALDAPPPGAAASAALATLATRFLTTPETAERIDRLLAECHLHWPGRAKLLELEPHCSAGFRAAAKPRLDPLRVRRSPGIPAIFPPPPTHHGKLDARTIPQRLPEDWLAPLATLDAPHQLLQQDAAIRLAQMARGGTRADAAFYLGFSRSQIGNLSARVRQWQRKDDNAQRYEEALSRLADLIAATPNLTNYQCRRDLLSQWTIPPDAWEMIIDVVRQQQNPASRHKTLWNTARYLGASAVVWAWATQGERLHAPALRSAQGSPSKQVRDTAVYESLWLENPDRWRTRHRPIHQLVHAALQEYRGQLIPQLDA
ncbi:TniQ family protein [Streptomyces antimycoticus]|uniref:TniQ family protein n=1 Tax=Streptomyces antimycoticus TaxID=68175 RepID=UPI0013751AEA|nr:TniQ family protein [Streptomyces antimycoticus]